MFLIKKHKENWYFRIVIASIKHKFSRRYIYKFTKVIYNISEFVKGDKYGLYKNA